MVMPGRKYTQPNSNYRYGFNGKENDNDVKGEGDHQDYGMRIYNPRLGRFLSVDPLSKEYPWNSTYAFAENDPINFIDLDGCERATPPRPGGGRGTRVSGLRSFAQSQANGVGHAARANREIRERAARINHIRQMRTNPAYASQYQTTNQFLQIASRENYLQTYFRNAFSTAQSVFGPGNISDNYKAGEKWDNLINTTMIQSGNYLGVARQISLKVVGQINGQTAVANIRVDNVGIYKDASGQVKMNLVEAKYSINDITINNVRQTLTPQQQKSEYILLNGKDVHIYVKGAGSAAELTQAGSAAGTAFKKDQDITGSISQINVVAPSSATTTTPKPNTPNP